MIQSIHIKNGQSHKDTELFFHRGLNVITGTSNHGKSAILRMLRWVAENKPTGEKLNAFRSWWGGKTWVEVVTWAGDVVVREKGKAGSFYFVNGKKLEAFNTDVPQEVQDILRLGPLNWQRQHDAPFLLSESAGEVGRQLNEIVDLSIIDRALSISQSELRDTKRDLLNESNRHAELKQQAAALAGVDDLAPLVEKMAKLERTIEHNTAQLSRLLKTRNAAFELQQAVRTNLADENLVAGRITRLTAGLEAVKQAEMRLDRLTELLDTILGQSDTENRLAALVVFGEKELKEKIGDTCPLCKQRIAQ